MNKVNLAEKFSRFADYWNPRIVGELNGRQVKLAKFKGGGPIGPGNRPARTDSIEFFLSLCSLVLDHFFCGRSGLSAGASCL